MVNNTNENFENFKIALEQASKIVTSPNASKEQRTNSENIFFEFRKSKSPYDFCRYLLETSKEPYVLFHAVCTLKEATLREWSLLPIDIVVELQNFLLNYLVNSVYQSSQDNTSFNVTNAGNKYVQSQILQTIAVFYKRSKLDSNKTLHSVTTATNSKITTNMINDLIELFKTSNIKLQQICCSLMLALLTEFSNTNRSSKLGLSGDSHFTAKRLFEQSEFKQLLVFLYETTQNLMQSLIQNNVTSIKALDKDSKDMLIQLFALIDQSFNWEFTTNKHILKNLIINPSQSNSSNNSSLSTLVLEPTPEFKEFFLNPDLITLLFKCYELVREDADMSHSALQPIIQLSTLNGPIFKDDDCADANSHSRLEFINNFLHNFLQTFSKIQIKEYESFNIACLMENLMSSTNVKKLDKLNPQLTEAFFNFACSFVINCFNAEKNTSDSMDSKQYLESYEKVLVAWTSVKDTLSDEECLNHPVVLILKNYAQTIVDGFVQSRLSSFNFESDKENIQLADDGVDVESVDDDDSAEDDLHRYKEILYSIGTFGKFSLEHTLPMLSRLLSERYLQLFEVLNRASKAAPGQNQIDANLLDKHLTSLSEDIHWLLLTTGFVLFEINSDHDEQVLIPRQIMNYSVMCSKFLDLNSVKSLFSMLHSPAAATSTHSFTPNAHLIEARVNETNVCDPIICLIFNSFQLCELETQMFSANMLQNLSPQVATSLMWFLKEFTKTYLFMKEENYTDISPTLNVLFGLETEIGTCILNFLLRKLYANFYIWSSENTTTGQTAKLLLEIVKHKDMCKILLHNEQFWSISRVAVVNEMPWILLPSSVKKIIIKSLIVSCSTTNSLSGTTMSGSSENNLMQAHFYNTILKPLSERFDALNNLKPELMHVESCIKEVMSLIETLNGIIEGASRSVVKSLMPFVLPRLQQGVHLLDMYHNYGEIVELILCMYNGVIEKFLANLNDWPDAKNQIYHCFLCLIQVFSKHNSGKRSIEANIEEDYYNDLYFFLSLLNTLLSIDAENQDLTQSVVQTNDQLNSVDIVLMSLEFLIPLMNQEILKFQSLCIEYFKLISNTAYTSPGKLFSKSFELFSTLISSVEYGLESSSGTEVVRLSLECIIALCRHVFVANIQQTNYGMRLQNVFKIVFDMIFRNSFEMEIFESYSSALYSLICSYQENYSILVSDLISQYQDENLKQKILQGFNSLTPKQNFTFNLEKKNRIKFSSKFNEFCVKTYGLLFIR